MPLSARLQALLASSPARVIAPVDIGTGPEALQAWAEEHGRTVTCGPPPAELERWLWFPRKRGEVVAWAETNPTAESPLVLTGADTLLDAEAWRAALGGNGRWAAKTYALARGWPAALPLARGLTGRGAAEEWYRHPLAAVALTPLLPPEALRSAYRALALSPLVTPGVASVLEITPETVEALAEGGWLWPVPGGWEIPGVLRRHLCPLPDPAQAGRVADELHRGGHTLAALTLLREAGAWKAHLTLLAGHLRATAGTDLLRASLRVLPPYWRERPEALYLAGLLARASGDLPRAEDLYTRALPGLPPTLAPLAANARGVVRAMRGNASGALADFEAASCAGGLTGGEAAHNRATLLVQLGRHAEAERSLDDAIAAFREAGDLRREARSLETLGALQFGRGLLAEALTPYEHVLRLQAEQPQETALTHVNLAEVHALLGDVGAARGHLEQARDLISRFGLAGWRAGWGGFRPCSPCTRGFQPWPVTCSRQRRGGTPPCRPRQRCCSPGPSASWARRRRRAKPWRRPGPWASGQTSKPRSRAAIPAR